MFTLVIQPSPPILQTGWVKERKFALQNRVYVTPFCANLICSFFKFSHFILNCFNLDWNWHLFRKPQSFQIINIKAMKLFKFKFYNRRFLETITSLQLGTLQLQLISLPLLCDGNAANPKVTIIISNLLWKNSSLTIEMGLMFLNKINF